MMKNTLRNSSTPTCNVGDAPSQVVGFRLSRVTAREVKSEAANRGMKLNELFEEIWEQYKEAVRPEANE